MFHWIEMNDQLLCAESGAIFMKTEKEKFNIIQYAGGEAWGFYYKTEAERDEAWDKLKAELGVR